MGSAAWPDELATARARRWWLTRRPVASRERAAAFVADVHLALLFPRDDLALPSLWEAVAGPDRAFAADGWGQPEERVWSWKAELPERGLAWLGPFVRGRRTFLSPAMLSDLYPGAGTPGDHRHVGLSPDAQRLASMLEASGATPQSVLRTEAPFDGRAGKARFDRAVTELGRHLLVTTGGVYDDDAGWPSVVLDLTPRLFDVAAPADPHRAVGRLLATTLALTARELATIFRWRVGEARGHLDRLVEDGVARPAEGAYVLGSGP